MRYLALQWRMGLVLAACWSVPATFSTTYAQSDSGIQQSVIPFAQSAPATGVERFTTRVAVEGDSGRRQRAAAIQQLPMAQLSPASRASVQSLLDELSLYRRLPTMELATDRRVYDFFTQYPDVAVSIWRAMDISNVQMWQTGPNDYELDTNDGTFGTVQVLHRSANSYLVLCQGQLQSPALRHPIVANAIMHLQPTYHENGTITHSCDLFVSFPSLAVETIARLISPVSNRIADRNFEEISLFVEMMCLGMQRQPGWVEQLTQQMDGLVAGRTDLLLSLTAAVYVDAERQRLTEMGKPISLDAIRPPVAGVPPEPAAR